VNQETARPDDFDTFALHEAMGSKRIKRGLSWRQVADEIWNQSAALNRRRQSHPISPSEPPAISLSSVSIGASKAA
jgi:hypothetical protein